MADVQSRQSYCDFTDLVTRSLSPASSYQALQDNNLQDHQAEHDNNSNLIINYIPPTVTEAELRSLFSQLGQVDTVKIVRDKTTGQCLGYAFVKYISAQDAHKAIIFLNGYRLQSKCIKVSLARPSSPAIKDANLYVSGLPKHMSQAHLEKTFSQFGDIVTAKILLDSDGNSRGVGFVRFNYHYEADHAVHSLNKFRLPGSTTPLQVKFAEKPSQRHASVGMYDDLAKALSLYKNRLEPWMTSIIKPYFPNIDSEMSSSRGHCVYVYNLPPDTNEMMLLQLFCQYGAILNARPMLDYTTGQCKGYAFVNMKTYEGALSAINSLNGKVQWGKPLQVSFKSQRY